MDDKFLSGLALAAISALNFVAYKHPSGYQKLSNPIMAITWVAWMGFLIWDMSIWITLKTLLPYIDSSKLNQAREAAATIEVISWKSAIGYLAFTAYMIFLSFMPNILDKQEPVEK